MVELRNSLTAHEEGNTSSPGAEILVSPPAKKKRNLPGMPDPEAEVIALSPKTLLATNRFICEICNKGFQRDQNLQLHRRGHNLPWKLRQRTNKEIRKKVYVCPESTCVHHDPKRALGDLTGIKKHFFRKHGEKKWKCERCSKNYAVRSDWKAHMKSCGTKEYRCDCGTLFSRRDSFITHRAFCEALAQESARTRDPEERRRNVIQSSSSSDPPPLTPSTCVLSSSVLSIQSSDAIEKQTGFLQQPPSGTTTMQVLNPSVPLQSVTSTDDSIANNGFLIFPPPPQPPSVSSFEMFNASPMSLSLVSGGGGGVASSSSMYHQTSITTTNDNHYSGRYIPQPAMSATALLQKAAQVGAATASSSFLCGLGFHTRSPSEAQPENSQRGNNIGFSSGGRFGSTTSNLMMGPISNLFCGSKPTTLDLLGIGIGGGGGGEVTGGFSSLITSMNGGGNGSLDGASGGPAFRGLDQQQLALERYDLN